VRPGVGACALALVLLAGCGGERAVVGAGGVDLADLLSTEAQSGFEDVTAPARLDFPRDHGPHPGHRIEWWYYTANLQAADGEAFGMQLALFRLALRPGAAAEGWEAGQVFMAHLSVGELDAGRFHFDQRLERPADGLAGARAEPFRAWVGPCRVESTQAASKFPLALACAGSNPVGEAFGVELELAAGKPRVLHGDQGYSEKSDLPGAASYYYAYTRLPASGALRLPGRPGPVAVTGEGWMDHEWGSIALGAGQAGWDWFSLQLDDGHELMFFQIRDRSGRPVSTRGSRIDPGGRVEAFAGGVVEAEPLRHWRSPHTGIRYPVAWRLRSRQLDLDLDVEAAMDDQELRTAVVYWEGAVRARGQHRGRPVHGRGFLELTGHD